MTEPRDPSASPLDAIDAAVDAVEQARIEEEAGNTIAGNFLLSGGRPVHLSVPHPFSADDFESVVVVLLKMRAASEARTAAEAPIILPRAKLVAVDGRNLT